MKIRGHANLVSSLLAYLISAVASWFSNSILSRFRMLLQIACAVVKSRVELLRSSGINILVVVSDIPVF